MARTSVARHDISVLSAHSKLIYITLSALFSILVIGVLISLFSHGLSTIAKDQLTALRENDLQKAYAMTTTAFKDQTNFDQFKEFVDTYPVLRQNKDVDFDHVVIEDDFGYLSGTAEAKDGTKMIIEYQFVRENDKWLIQAMRLSPLGT